MKKYMKDEMCVGQYRTLAYAAWLHATVRDQMPRAVERKDWTAAETVLLTANLGMAAYNQGCLQGGSD
eukprot:8919366-Heterocapsa_arctica.AAC.1